MSGSPGANRKAGIIMKKVADLAVPILTEGSETPTDKVSAAIVHITAIKSSPEWATAPEVQTATAAWETVNTKLDENNTLIADLESQLKKARTSQLAEVRRWEVRKRGLLTAVNAVCDGSKDRVNAFGLGVQQRTSQPQAGVPEGLRARRSKTVGKATAVWNSRPGHYGFMVQYATNPADAATYSPPIVVSRAKFELARQVPGSKVYVRVLALDPSLPTGQTEFTSWVAVTVTA
jgi:hypothetical protein